MDQTRPHRNAVRSGASPTSIPDPHQAGLELDSRAPHHGSRPPERRPDPDPIDPSPRAGLTGIHDIRDASTERPPQFDPGTKTDPERTDRGVGRNRHERRPWPSLVVS